jgi:ABC-type transporter Mla subunit MlaD
MDIEGTMQFILDQQAQFSSEVARINSVLQRTSEILANLAECQNKSEQIIQEVRQTLLAVANAQERTNEILATLAERQVATEEARRATEEALSRLAERQGTTEENLNVLLLTVERHISNHN